MRVRFEPSGVTIDVVAGQTILSVAQAAGVEIEALCNGAGTCAKCKVIVEGSVAPMTDIEREHLTEREIAKGYRFACQTEIEGDIEVLVPQESRTGRVSILEESGDGELEVDPWVVRRTATVPPTDLEHQTPDWANLVATLGPVGAPLKPTLAVLRQLPHALRAQDGALTLTEIDGVVVRVVPGHVDGHPLGVAFDIGTTTVVGYLMDLVSGEQLAVASRLNPQTRYGDDVVSRIQHTIDEDDGQATLQSAVVEALNDIVVECCDEAAREPGEIMAATMVGNTTMHHLVLGISPKYLAQAPYVPVMHQAVTVSAPELGLAIAGEGVVSVLPNIAGWVGADTVGVLLATGVWRKDEMALAIDIGTNGEMALGSRDRLIACSTAAGPAFEGAHLSCGMRAADGAIEWVEIDQDVAYRAIGGAAPRGLCGSGLVDVVAEMLKTGLIQPTGMLQSADVLREHGSAALADRILGQGRQREFELVSANEGAGAKPVRISQRDVRELQLAKGAIRAGIEIMLLELGVTAEDVSKVYLAGAFGNYIQPKSALGIGLIPALPNAELVPVGNAAGAGAKMALLSRSAREDASRLLAQVEYLELSGRPDFQAQFAEAMMF